MTSCKFGDFITHTQTDSNLCVYVEQKYEMKNIEAVQTNIGVVWIQQQKKFLKLKFNSWW